MVFAGKAMRRSDSWPWHKTIYNRFSIRMERCLGSSTGYPPSWRGKGTKPDRLMIDATHLKAHRTAASLLKKGLFPDGHRAHEVGGN